MKPQSQLYSVQPLAPDGSKDGGLISTGAFSPLKAAEQVVGEPLSLHGKVPKAQVWAMDDGYQATLVVLYASDASP